MNCLLLDANVIIDLHTLGFWNGFVTQNKVSIASTVFRVEALYYYDKSGNKTSIDIMAQVQNGSITELSADVKDQAGIIAKFNKQYDPELDAGELESIAIIVNSKDKDLKFCTCDGAAIRAVSMLQLDDRAVSLEAAIKQSGMKVKDVEYEHSEKRFKKILTEGKLNLVGGRAIKK